MRTFPIRIFICCVIALTGMGPVSGTSGHAAEWEYGEGFAEELLFLHAMINYEFHPDWARQWEHEQMKSTGLRASFGSVSKSQLLHSEDIVLNTDIGSGWYFRTHLNWYGSRHEDINRSSQFIEFQKNVFGPVSLTAAADLRHNKDETDGAFGLLVTSPSRTEYAALRFLWDDLAYHERNRDGGRVNRHATGVGWLVRWERDRWTVFTEGRYTGGFSREFTDAEKSPELAVHDQQCNHARLTAAYSLERDTRIEAELSHVHFDEGKQYRTPGSDYCYLHEIHHGVVRWIQPAGPFRQVRMEVHGVIEHAHAGGFHALDYDRRDIMPALFLRFGPGKCPLELGYFSSVYDWDYDRRWEGASGSDAGYADKLKIDWSIEVSENARVLFSLSHVVELKRFGGGNVQVQILK